MIKLLANRWSHFLLLLVLVCAAVFYSPSDYRWRREMQYLVFDSLNRIFPREPSGEIVIVDIDDDSLKAIGQWPWPRTDVASMVSNLTDMGARVIAFDGVLAEPDRSSPRFVLESVPATPQYEDVRAEISNLEDHDAVLARTIKDSDIFVSGFTFASYSQTPDKPRIVKNFLVKKGDKEEFLTHAPHFKVAAVFLPELEKAAAGNGSFMAFPDSDGVLRRTGVIFSDGQTLYPSLGLEALRIATGDRKLIPKIRKLSFEERKTIDTAYRIGVGKYDIPVESDGLMWMYYRQFDENGDDYLSAHKLINPDAYPDVREQVSGKIVLVGSSAEGLKDLRSTAIEPFQPGVEIHANAIEQFLQNKYLMRPNVIDGVEAIFILLSGLLIIILAPFIHVLVMAALCAGFMGLAFMGSVTAYTDYSVLIDPFYASLCIFGVFVASTLLTYLRVESERKQVRSAFGHYISPEFMDELANDPDKLKLGGEIKDLTVMFTDIRSFTTISEGLTPEELIQLMNDFLTPMSDLVMQNRGTIDKYMGDAMMAFWNAPLDVSNHEHYACQAALSMQDALWPINRQLKKKADKEGVEPVLLQAGIGINTGPCAVGNMGSKQRFAYSALGDAVNLASRLEGQTKTYGVNILIGESTYNEVPDLAALEIDLLRVKGKVKPVRVFALLGDEDMCAIEEFKVWEYIHNDMLAAYRSQEFEYTKLFAEECKALDISTLDVTYDLYIERAEEMIKNPPGKDWEGVFEAETK